jgi:hypothetical protein
MSALVPIGCEGNLPHLVLICGARYTGQCHNYWEEIRNAVLRDAETEETDR